jgi:hypothetical protein
MLKLGSPCTTCTKEIQQTVQDVIQEMIRVPVDSARVAVRTVTNPIRGVLVVKGGALNCVPVASAAIAALDVTFAPERMKVRLTAGRGVLVASLLMSLGGVRVTQTARNPIVGVLVVEREFQNCALVDSADVAAMDVPFAHVQVVVEKLKNAKEDIAPIAAGVVQNA